MALQTVLDFIAKQQRYCQERESDDGAGGGSTPELPHPNIFLRAGDATSCSPSGAPPAACCSLTQLRSLIPSHDDDDSSRDADNSEQDDDEDGVAHRGFSTAWMPVRTRADHVDLNSAEVSGQSNS